MATAGNGLTTTEIEAIFVKPTPIVGEPEYASLHELQQTLYSNAANIPSQLGGGKHGHLGIIMSPSLYGTISSTPYIAPNDPGPTPNYTGVSAVAARLVIKDVFTADQKNYQMHTTVENTLKKYLIRAIDEVYMEEKKDRYTGFMKHTTAQLMTFLFDRYGKITPSDIHQNLLKISEKFDVTQPISLYFKKVDDCIQFADAGNAAFSDQHIVQITLHAMQSTGVLLDDCKNWKKRTTNKTWADFKTFFGEAYNEYKQNLPITNQQLGYANTIDMQATPSYNDTSLEVTQNRGNTPTVTSDPSTTVASSLEIDFALENLAMTVTTNTQDSIQSLKNQLQTVIDTNAILTAQLRTFMSNGNNQERNRNNNGNAVSNNNNPRYGYDPNGYCWSHGFKVKTNHSSRTCNRPMVGHNRNATRMNILGGNTAYQGWRMGGPIDPTVPALPTRQQNMNSSE